MCFRQVQQTCPPVKDANRVEAQSLQVFLQKFGNLPVVLDHKYVCHSPCHTISPRAQMFMALFYHPAWQIASFKVLQCLLPGVKVKAKAKAKAKVRISGTGKRSVANSSEK